MTNPFAPVRADPDNRCGAESPSGEYNCTIPEDRPHDTHAYVDENMSWVAGWLADSEDGDTDD
jgi:hypothetical protein